MISAVIQLFNPAKVTTVVNFFWVYWQYISWTVNVVKVLALTKTSVYMRGALAILYINRKVTPKRNNTCNLGNAGV